MKSEPDKLDFLIVLLPLVLVGLLGFQVYQYFQVDHDLVLATPLNTGAPQETPAEASPSGPGGAGAEDTQVPAEPAPAPEGNEAAAPALEVPDEATTGDAEPPAVAEGAPDAADQQVPDTEPVEGAEIAADGATPQATAAGNGASAVGEQLAAPEEKANPGTRRRGLPRLPSDLQRPLAPEGGAASASELQPEPAPEEEEDATGTAAEEVEPQPFDGTPDEGAVPEGAGVVPEEQAGYDEGDGGTNQVFIEASPPEAEVGSVLALEIRIRDAGDVAGVIFHLKFDATLVEPNSDPQSDLGDFLPSPRFVVNPVPGRLVAAITTPGMKETRSGEGLVATLYFKVLAAGDASFTFENASVRGPGSKTLPAEFSPIVVTLTDLP